MHRPPLGWLRRGSDEINGPEPQVITKSLQDALINPQPHGFRGELEAAGHLRTPLPPPLARLVRRHQIHEPAASAGLLQEPSASAQPTQRGMGSGMTRMACIGSIHVGPKQGHRCGVLRFPGFP